MSEDNNQTVNSNQQSDPQVQTVAISVEEYNQLQGKLRKYETDLAYSQKSIEDLKLESKGRKPRGDDQQKPDEQLRSLQEQLNATTEQLGGFKSKLKTKTISEHFATKVVTEFLPSAKDWILRDILNEVDLDGDDFDQPRLVIKDASGQPRWSKIKPNERMGVDEYLEELKAKRPDFVLSKKKSGEPVTGGDTNYNAQASRQLTRNDIFAMSQDELTELAKSKDGEAIIQKALRTI